jgi:xylan 1,4-beta-xylosidase
MIALPLLISLLLCGVANAEPRTTWTADNGNGTYTNPLFHDEFSDPDIIRVGDDFYLTGTTMHAMPGLPVLRSRDLVNWEFLSYASDRLDLGPAFRLEDGKNVYGRGLWAPSLRYHKGTFYIFSNVNGHTTQIFSARDPRGPWQRRAMKRNLHDLSVLFDDDGKAYAVWGYQEIRFAQLNEDLSDIVPATEQIIIPKGAGMGEGLHFYKLNGKYFILSAEWDYMKMPAARADRITGPYEVNKAISIDEDFGLRQGYRLDGMTPRAAQGPFRHGAMSMHQGGIVQAPDGAWWGVSMFEGNSVGRLTALSPVTWKDGWPYFGLPGNLTRSPRTWIKPVAGVAPAATYERSDDFSAPLLKPVWQWNHVPVDGKWSLTERAGYLRLHTLPAQDFLEARNTLTQRAIGPRSTPTVLLDASGLAPGDLAGFALLNRPYTRIGVERSADGLYITRFDEGRASLRKRIDAQRVWLRAECDFLTEHHKLSYSLDGQHFEALGDDFITAYQLKTFQGVRYALFAYHGGQGAGGFADFDSIDVHEPTPRGVQPIPYGRKVVLQPGLGEVTLLDRGMGRVAISGSGGFLTVAPDGASAFRAEVAGDAQTFQWIETFTGEVTLLSLQTHRYLRVAGDALLADSPGPAPAGNDGTRFIWHASR